MDGNLLLEQFSRYKKLELEASPFHFLLDANIELNPHQINAFCAAIQALKTGGIVLADEVGLGKTIEAGLVLKYALESGAKRVLIALPASLRKQWELELEDKFGLDSVILDRIIVEKESSNWRKKLMDNKSVRIVLTSYDYSSKLMKRFPEVKWDFVIIDEAHNLRNVFHGTKRAKNLYELSKGIPKVLLTSTPLQNSLTLLDSISELSYDDAAFVIDVVEQYLSQIPGDEENKRRIVRRYASLIVSDIRKQIYVHMDRKTQDVHIIQKDLILFRKFVKNVKENGKVKYDKLFSDKSNIKKYLFTGYKKSYYPANAFDSDTERLVSIIFEEDSDVIRWIKPPLNQLGLFWKTGQQYNPDFLVETTAGKFMVEVKALNEVTSEEVVSKAREGIKWCQFATTADPDHKKWEYKLISDDNVHIGNTCKYTLGTAHAVKEE